MRQLNSIELKEKFEYYSHDIVHCEVDDLTIKLDQFIYFLNDQAISKRILSRIEEEFQSLKSELSVEWNQRPHKYHQNILGKLCSREIQGAFGYFYITEKYKADVRPRTHYLDEVRNWYHGSGDYNAQKDRFKTYFFEPFVELFDWFLRESEAINPKDYFSENSRTDIIARINSLEESLLVRMDAGNQIVFEEVEEVKELITFLNKKNWTELIKGKFVELALSELISKEMANSIVESMIGTKIDLFKSM